MTTNDEPKFSAQEKLQLESAKQAIQTLINATASDFDIDPSECEIEFWPLKDDGVAVSVKASSQTREFARIYETSLHAILWSHCIADKQNRAEIISDRSGISIVDFPSVDTLIGALEKITPELPKETRTR